MLQCSIHKHQCQTTKGLARAKATQKYLIKPKKKALLPMQKYYELGADEKKLLVDFERASSKALETAKKS